MVRLMGDFLLMEANCRLLFFLNLHNDQHLKELAFRVDSQDKSPMSIFESMFAIVLHDQIPSSS